MARGASILLSGSKIAVHCNCEISAGLWVMAPPFHVVDTSIDAEELGGLIDATLQESRTVESPSASERKVRLKALVDSMGFKRIEALTRGAVECLVTLDQGQAEFLGTRGKGSGFDYADVSLVEAGDLTKQRLGNVDRATGILAAELLHRLVNQLLTMTRTTGSPESVDGCQRCSRTDLERMRREWAI